MIYDVTLRITYDYANPATGGRHLVRLLPRDLPAEQRLIAGHIDIQPPPSERSDRVDFFGNPVTEFAFRHPYDEVALTLHARVDRRPLRSVSRGHTALSGMAGAVADVQTIAPDAPGHFTAPSPRVRPDPAMTTYARALVHPGMSAEATVQTIGAALHRDMTFDPDATEVDTPASDAFAARHGVCQDYTHIMIACLRAVGVPAGYVSGFLRTLPPPGKPRLEGADAMHAWVMAWAGPGVGWIEYDPTNGIAAGTDHIVVARGRDYFDVAPIKGILRIAGEQTSEQAVDVIPLEP